jgi:hypothetical protein
MASRFHNTVIRFNNRAFLAESVDISQEASLVPSFRLNNYTSTDSLIDGPSNNSISIQYPLTGKDYLRDFISTKPSEKITGYIGGLYFNHGYLNGYNLTIEPNKPIFVNASIVVFDTITGSYQPNTTPLTVQKTKPLSATDATYSVNNMSEVSLSNIESVRWSYQANFQPSYYYRDSGFSTLYPDFVSMGERSVDVEISSDDDSISLPISGSNLAFDINCYHSTSDVYEKFSCSGKINRKSFSSSVGQSTNSVYSIKQYHINDIPFISSVNTSTYSTNRKIVIYATGSDNTYLTQYNNFSIIERVFIGDSECSFTVAKNPLNNAITGTLPLDAINGILSIQTTRGTVNYPSGLLLSHPVITISGFYPITGKQNDQVTISGVNFYRISNVKFGEANANFEVSSTGATHFIRTTVPANANVGPITISSLLRNNSGISSRSFFPLMRIDSLNPATGTFGATITISGFNFSGVTGIYFNNIRSTGINIVSNTTATALTPATGSGYAGGFVTMYGTGGMRMDSNYHYYPIISITGVRTNPVELTIDLDKFDSGYFCPHQGGYKVRVDSNIYSFARYGGTNSITGLINFSLRYPKISVYRPDGLATYPNYTGNYTQIGPAPTISRINFNNQWNTVGNNFNIYKYGTYNIKVEGNAYRDFYSRPWFAILRHNINKNLYNPVNSFSSYLSDTEAAIEFSITGRTGYYDLIVQNVTGSGIFTGAFHAYNPLPLSTKCNVSQSPTITLINVNNQVVLQDARPSLNAIDQYTKYPKTTLANGMDVYPHALTTFGNLNTNVGSLDTAHSMFGVTPSSVSSGAWWQMQLKDEYLNGQDRVDVREIYLSRHDVPHQVNFNYQGNSYGSRSSVYTTFITVYNKNDEVIYNTEADFDLTFGNMTPKGLFMWSGISAPLSGFKKLVVYYKSQPLVDNRGVALNGVELY